MSHCGYFVTILMLVTSGLLSFGSFLEKKFCFNVSNEHICYFQPKEALTVKQWEMARSICKENSATLPIIENEEVRKTFKEYLRNISLNTREIWLGGRQLTKKEWLWSNKKPFHQPNLLHGEENLINQAVIQRTSYSESPSNATLRYIAAYPSWICHYICQYSASRCPADNSTIQNEHNGCLKVFHDLRLNPSEATKKCNNSGGYLATFDGDEFLTKAPKVYQQMQPYRPPYHISYCIGLHRTDTKSWFWMRSNNENSTMEGNYSNWSDRNNNSNGDCLFATANDYRWEASGCNAWKGFICQTTPTTTDSTSKKSTTATTDGNTHTTVTIAATINNHNDESSTTVSAAIGAGIVIIILCIIVILVVICRKSKSSNNKTESTEMDSKNTYDSKDKKTKENKSSKPTEERSIYADIPLAEKTANDTVEGVQKGIVYASLDFNQGVTYAEPLYENTQDVSGPIYAEPLNATGNGTTSAGSSPAVKTGPMGDVYTLPTTNVTPSSDKTTERPIYANT